MSASSHSDWIKARTRARRRSSGGLLRVLEDAAQQVGGLAPFVALQPEQERRLVGKYWYSEPTLTPARSATRAVVKRCAPSFAKT